MKVFVTADTQFFDSSMIRVIKRPFKNVYEMNKIIKDKWNNKVSPYDLVIHLGDFAWASKKKIREIRNMLNGTIIIIPGNHDRKGTLRKLGFIVVGKAVRMGNLVLTHKPIKVYGRVINVHGHIHNKKSYYGINVSVDVTNFEPVPIEKYFKQAEEMLQND